MRTIAIATLPYALLLFVPISLFLRYIAGAPVIWVFVAGVAAIAVLADWVRRATEQVAERTGSTIGSLLNVSFGNAAELVLALFVLSSTRPQIVQAQITGSIIGTTLLYLGIAALVGGIGRVRQTFNQARSGLFSTLLFLVVIAILLPAVFNLTEGASTSEADLSRLDEHLSLGVSVVLLLLYGANLIYVLITHRDIFAKRELPSGDEPEWSLARGLSIMIAGTVLIALESELVSSGLDATAMQLGLSTVFMGVVVLALVGSAADLIASVAFARRDQMDVAFSMCVGSAVQMALVIAPILVLVSWFIGTPMNLVFGSPLDLFAIGSAAFVVRTVAADGETTWFEGLLLIGVYVLFAVAYFFENPARS
ncbi:MAG TPA: calcium/proton exchanger [Acetobacteraceae bacterium]|nr:calcium/proton exchanger [Acetobacteraceae bacterium]